jgi:hypothetical protein
MTTDRTCLMTLKRSHTTICASLALLALVTPVSATAGGLHAARPGEKLLTSCIQRAAGGKPWLEKTLWGLRDQEGGWAGAEVANADGSHDLGPLQVNSWWVAKIAAITGRRTPDIRHWLIHDVCFNVDTARWIFLEGLTVTRDYWRAIGAYHSPAGWRQRRYAMAVARRLNRRFGPSIFAARSPNRGRNARSGGKG